MRSLRATVISREHEAYKVGYILCLRGLSVSSITARFPRHTAQAHHGLGKRGERTKTFFCSIVKFFLPEGDARKIVVDAKFASLLFFPLLPLSLLFPPHFCRPKNEAAHYVPQHGSNFEHARCLGGGVSFFSGRSRSSDLFLAKQLLEGWMRPLAYILAVVTTAR